MPGKWFFAFINGLVLSAFGGGIVSFVKRYPFGTNIRKVHITHVLAVTFLLVTLAGNVYWSFNQHAAQGRLALIAMTVISTYLCAGIISLVGQHLQKIFSIIFVTVLLIVSVLMVKLYIEPSYTVPKKIVYEEIPSNMIASGVIFNNTIQLNW